EIQAPVTWPEAIDSIDSRLKEIAEADGASCILGFASGSATNESLFLFKRYLKDRVGSSTFDFRLDSEDKTVTELEDNLLRRRDKHANSMGALKLGLIDGDVAGLSGAIDAARAGRIKAGVIIYFRPLVARPGDDEADARIGELVKSLAYSVVFTAYKAEWQS